MRRLLAAVAIVAFVTPISAQAAKPSLVGTWVFDVAKSESGEMPLPAAITWTFVQHGDTLVMDRDVTNEAGGAKLLSKVTVGLDGKPWKNSIPQPDGSAREVHYAISYEATTLLMTITSEIEGTPIVQTDRYTKSADGMTLTVARQLTADGEVVATATMVFAKRP